jgi:hypothetical protein
VAWASREEERFCQKQREADSAVVKVEGRREVH